MIKTDKAIYRTRTLTEYDWLMEKLEEAGCVWINVRKPTESAKFYMYKSDTCIFVEDKKLIYSDFDFYKNESDYKDYEFIEVSELMGNEKETEESVGNLGPITVTEQVPYTETINHPEEGHYEYR